MHFFLSIEKLAFYFNRLCKYTSKKEKNIKKQCHVVIQNEDCLLGERPKYGISRVHDITFTIHYMNYSLATRYTYK